MAKDGADPDPINQEMGRRVAEERRARGWTQKQLAENTGWSEADADAGKARGMSPSRIANYEQGERRFSLEEAEMFATAFGDLPSAYFMCVVDRREASALAALRATPGPKTVARL